MQISLDTCIKQFNSIYARISSTQMLSCSIQNFSCAWCVCVCVLSSLVETIQLLLIRREVVYFLYRSRKSTNSLIDNCLPTGWAVFCTWYLWHDNEPMLVWQWQPVRALLAHSHTLPSFHNLLLFQCVCVQSLYFHHRHSHLLIKIKANKGSFEGTLLGTELCTTQLWRDWCRIDVDGDEDAFDLLRPTN